MVAVGPLAPVDPVIPPPRCWCGERGEETVDGERLCAAGHLYRESEAHRLVRECAESGFPVRLDPDLVRESEQAAERERAQAVAKLAMAFDVPADVLHIPSGLNHWATAWGAHLADMGPQVVPLTPSGQPGVCRHGDRHCPCPDGDPCHYTTHGDSAAMPCPRTGTVDCDCGSCP